MFGLLKRYQKHRAIKKYINNLGPSLQSRYGASEYYTEAQIKVTLEKSKIGGEYIAYAYGLYVIPKELGGILEKLGESKTAKSIRKYLATKYVGGSIDYNYDDIMEYSSGTGDASSSGSGCSAGYSGGGDSGGGGGD